MMKFSRFFVVALVLGFSFSLGCTGSDKSVTAPENIAPAPTETGAKAAADGLDMKANKLPGGKGGKK